MESPESPELSRHLDDELPRAQLPENLRQEAEAFDRVIAAIGRGPDRLPRSVREQVMQQVRAIHAPWWARAWRWFATPRPMRLSPLHGTLALAALVAVVPHLTVSGAGVLWLRLALLLGMVVAVGLAAGLAAAVGTLRAPVLTALRRE